MYDQFDMIARILLLTFIYSVNFNILMNIKYVILNGFDNALFKLKHVTKQKICICYIYLTHT